MCLVMCTRKVSYVEYHYDKVVCIAVVCDDDDDDNDNDDTHIMTIVIRTTTTTTTKKQQRKNKIEHYIFYFTPKRLHAW